MLVAECLTSLLFPFQWTLLYVPIVFTAALVCLDVPVPAIMGLKLKKSFEGNELSPSSNPESSETRSESSDDDATFEVQRCLVNIDTGRIQLPDDMARFPDRSEFIKELNQLIFRFNDELDQDLLKYSTKYSSRTRESEDWTHLNCLSDNEQDKHPNNESQTSQALKRLAAIAKRTGIVTNHYINDQIKSVFAQDELVS